MTYCSARAFLQANSPSESQRRVLLTLDLDQGIENHWATFIEVHRVSAHVRLLIGIRIPSVYLEVLGRLGRESREAHHRNTLDADGSIFKSAVALNDRMNALLPCSEIRFIIVFSRIRRLYNTNLESLVSIQISSRFVPAISPSLIPRFRSCKRK